ncbi:MAG: hypothetical protein WD989_02480 [Candidatus Paceibacterota bacterium]
MIRNNIKKHRKYYLAILFAVVLVLLPTHEAKAISILEFGYSAVLNIFAYTAFILFSVAGSFISFLAIGLNTVINIRVYPDGGIAVIDESWKIMRNFANMFFIVALIMMAFATIFNISKYDARTLFPKFLIAALLINFSLVLGVLVIDASQVLSNTFLTSIGDMSAQLGQGLNPSNLLPGATSSGFEAALTSGANGTDQTISGALIQIIFSLILVLTFLFSLLTAFIFALIRIPILWALLVVSPIAWILSVFPAGQGMYKKWWSTFIGWNMFLPIFLFFLYFGLYFLSSQTEIMTAIASQTRNQDFGTGVPNFFQLLFFYVLAAIFLIGGTITAMKAAMFSGTGVVGVAKWSRGVVARRLGLTAAGTAAQQRLEQFKQEGLPGRIGQKLYGGDYGLAQQTGRFGERFGVRGAGRANEKAFVDRAGKDYTDFERQYQNGQLTEADVLSRAKQFNATDPRGFAYRKLAAKIGQLDNDMFTSTLTQLSKNPLAAEDFAKTAGASKFSKMKGPDLARMAAAEKGVDPKTGIPYDYTSLKSSVAARREMYRYVQTDKKAAGGLSKEQFEAGLGVFGGHTTAESKAFMKEIAKVSPDFVMDYNLSNPDLNKEATEGFERAHKAPPSNEFQLKAHLLGGSLKSGDIKDTAGINLRVWREDGTPEEKENAAAFKESLKLYIGRLRGKARTNYVNRLEKALLDTDGGDKKVEILYSDILDPAYAGRSPVPGTIPPAARGGKVPLP